MKMRVDEVLHAAYCAPAMYKRTPEEIRCKICGRWLKTYYAEERLYSVWCRGCAGIGRLSEPEAHQKPQRFSE